MNGDDDAFEEPVPETGIHDLSDDGLLDGLRVALERQDDAPDTRILARKHRDNIRLAITSRGDVFNQGDTVLLERVGAEPISVPVDSLPVTLGSSSKTIAPLKSPGVSRVHCRLEREGVLVRLVDAGSSCGTVVNDETVESIHLRDGDLIRLGVVQLTVRRR